MTIYWHPFLAEMLRLSYADRIIIQEQLPLGDLPLEADLLLLRRDPKVVPVPFGTPWPAHPGRIQEPG